MNRFQMDLAVVLSAPPRLDDFPSAEERAAELAWLPVALRAVAAALNRIADALAQDEAGAVRAQPAVRRN